jgi:hypothetical protein
MHVMEPAPREKVNTKSPGNVIVKLVMVIVSMLPPMSGTVRVRPDGVASGTAVEAME